MRNLEEGLSKTEKRVVATAAVMMLLFGSIFVSDPAFDFLFGHKREMLSRPGLGTILRIENDVRRKDSRHFVWKASPELQQIADGDSIFIGDKSKAEIELNGGGGRVEIGEQSLVRFRVVGSDQVPDLQFGTLRLQGGNVKVFVQGKAVDLGKTGGPVDLKLGNDGRVTVTSAKGATAPRVARVINPQPEMRHPPVPLPDEGRLTAHWRFDDLFERDGGRIVRRDQRPKALALKSRVRWKDLGGGPYRVQIADNDAFAGSLIEGRAESTEFELSPLFIGDTFWRVSSDGIRWSQPQAVKLDAGFRPEVILPNASPGFMAYFGQPVAAALSWTRPETLTSTLVEVSSRNDFSPNETMVFWTRDEKLEVMLPAEGTYFIRWTGMDESQRLSVPSAVASIRVENPALLASPQVPSNRLVFPAEGGKTLLAWRGPKGAVRHRLEIFDEQGRKVSETLASGDRFSYEPKTPGAYTYRVTPIDQWGRDGQVSAAKRFELLKPVPVAKAPEIPRAPAQDPEPRLATSIPQPTSWFFNDAYSESKWQVEAASFGALSSEQATAGAASAIAATLAVKWTRWWKNLGVEWAYKSKVFDYNAAASSMAPTSMEVRGALRTLQPMEWTNWLREIQIAGVFGYETYRNPQGGTLYTPGYDLMKLGVQLEFPVGSRWQSGGEILMGKSPESSQKFEISGHLNYFMRRDLTFGVGYRAHAFQAGSLATTPLGLPYREAYGEGFTMLRYLY